MAGRFPLRYYLVATEGKMIPPPAQRALAQRAKTQGTEVPGSHAVYVSKPAEIAAFIRQSAGSAIAGEAQNQLAGDFHRQGFHARFGGFGWT